MAGRRAFLTAVIIGQRLLATAAINFNSSSYARNVSLDAGVDIFWTINGEAGTIRVAVHAKDATGWASVGISEMGGMEGSDIVFYEAAVRYTARLSHRITDDVNAAVMHHILLTFVPFVRRYAQTTIRNNKT